MNAAEALPEVQMAPLVFQFVGEEIFLKNNFGLSIEQFPCPIWLQSG